MGQTARPILKGALLSVALTLANCSTTNSSNTLAGPYVCVYPFAVELLFLDKDGTYLQIAQVNGQEDPLVHRGAWSYDFETINLQNPILVSDDFGNQNQRASTPIDSTWVLSVKSSLGAVRLRWNPDLDYEFRKLR